MSSPTQHSSFYPLERFFAWLGGSGLDTLQRCPDWEIRRQAIFGATVLIPTLFGAAASAYAVSTLTSNFVFVVLIAFFWAFVILTIDRAFLASHRSTLPTTQKVFQFGLRFVVAVLMGMTIAHPMVLLLFKAGVQAEIALEQSQQIDQLRQTVNEQTTQYDAQLVGLQNQLSDLRDQYRNTFEIATSPSADPIEPDDLSGQLTLLDHQIAEQTEQRTQLTADLRKWQTAFDDEVAGKGPSGTPGLGANARRIQDQELTWRKTELERISTTLSDLASKRSQLFQAITDLKLSPEQQALAAARAKAQLADLEQRSESQRYLRQDLQLQITALNEQVGTVQDRREALFQEADTRALATPSTDLISQTLALHRLFEKPGGHFAFMVYLVIGSVFVILDTIPIVVKFSAKPGPYDFLVEFQETHFQPGEETGAPTDLTWDDKAEEALIEEEEPPPPPSSAAFPPRLKSRSMAKWTRRRDADAADSNPHRRLRTNWTRPPGERATLSRPLSPSTPSDESVADDSSPPSTDLELQSDHVVIIARKLALMRSVFRTNAELAHSVGINASTLSKYFKLLKISESLQEELLGIPDLTLEIAYRIACLDNVSHQNQLLQLCRSGVSQRQIRAAITDLKRSED